MCLSKDINIMDHGNTITLLNGSKLHWNLKGKSDLDTFEAAVSNILHWQSLLYILINFQWWIQKISKIFVKKNIDKNWYINRIATENIDILIITETKLDKSSPKVHFLNKSFCELHRLDWNSEGGDICYLLEKTSQLNFCL